jgi:hypothetical protein
MIRLLMIIIALTVITACEGKTSEADLKKTHAIEEFSQKRFLLVALRSYVVYAVDPKQINQLVYTRYTPQVEQIVISAIKGNKLCHVTGFSALVKGYLKKDISSGSFMLAIESLSDIQPLSPDERKQLGSRSPTLNRELSCEVGPDWKQ